MKRLFKLPLSRNRLRGDVDAELDFHLEGRIEDLIARGLSREDATREARRRFGDRVKVENEVERIDAATLSRQRLRDRAGACWRDARYAIRGLLRRPLFACAVVGTLALAIGANTTVFSVLEAVLLRPFAFPDIGHLAVVHDDFPAMNLRHTSLSPLESLDLFARTDLFTVATAYSSEGVTIELPGGPARTTGTRTLGEFWTIVGARPLYGRLYRPEDSRYGAARVVVLSYGLWQRLTADTAILGTSVTIDDTPYEVIGIMPAGFAYPRNVLYWRPFVLDANALDNTNSRGTLTHTFIGRMPSGLTIPALTTRLGTLANEWHATYTSNYQRGGHTMIAESFVDMQAGTLKPIVLLLFGAVVLVLLIACANVASLQLVRSAGRARELAVRAALGAGRAAIARQLIVESTLLAALGGALGVGLGKVMLLWLTHANVAQFPALRTVKLDGFVLAFTAGAVALAGILFGTAPALRAARTDVNDALRDSGRGSSGGLNRHRFLRGSVVLQNALVLVLLAGAGLTIRSLGELLRVDPGFNPDHVMGFTVALPVQRYHGAAQRLAFFRTLDERLKAIPGVQSVGFALGAPFFGGAGNTSYTLQGIPQMDGEPQRHADQVFVFGDYFKTMGIQIVKGRAIGNDDVASGPVVAVVDETLVRQSFGARDPVGTTIAHGAQPATIVGVARPVKLFALDDTPHPLVYHDYEHAAVFIASLTAVVRSSLPADQVVKAVRATVADVDPRLPTPGLLAFSSRMRDTLGARRLATNVLAGFAVLALVIAVLGVYAVMSYVVNERSREIGIRVALGAQRAQISGMVLRDGAVLAVLGLGIGAVTFVAAGRIVRSLLFGVTMLDPTALGGAVALLVAVTLIACWLPARRAARVDPVVTLRAE